MSIIRPDDICALLAFYVEAGVDAMLDEAPVDRLTAWAQEPHSSPVSADGPPASLRPPQARPPLDRADDTIVNNARPRLSPVAPAPRGEKHADTPLAPDAAIMAARQAAANAASLDVLRAIIDGFEGCALRFTAKQLVFADGNPRARVMFVGEAPGRDEDIAGRAFVGRSGQLLDRMMAAIGLDRTAAYIANVVPWRPPGNRTPTPQETQICLPFIKRQIELADPDILVCLGGPSAAALLGLTGGIRRFRGRWCAYHTGTREVRAIATFHPAYLLRTPLEKRFAWRDFQAIKTALGQ
jgi:uracil-DNA glycosylase